MRFAKYNLLAATALLGLWILLVVIEVKIALFPQLKYVFFASLPCAFFAFYLANLRALSPTDQPELRILKAIALSLLVTPCFIFLGVILATNFKFLIGGHQ